MTVDAGARQKAGPELLIVGLAPHFEWKALSQKVASQNVRTHNQVARGQRDIGSPAWIHDIYRLPK